VEQRQLCRLGPHPGSRHTRSFCRIGPQPVDPSIATPVPPQNLYLAATAPPAACRTPDIAHPNSRR